MYQVILTGVREGIARPDAVKNLAVLFKTTPEQVEKLLATSGFVLKKGITEEVAKKYRAAIEASGGACRVEQEITPVQTLDVDLLKSLPSQAIPKMKSMKLSQSTWKKELPKIGVFFAIFLIIYGWVALSGKSSKGSKPENTTSPQTPSKLQELQRQSENVDMAPSSKLRQIVKSNALVRGYIDNQSIPSIEISFSNGHMDAVSQPGLEVTPPGSARNPFTEGLVHDASTPNATCVGIETEDRLGAYYGELAGTWSKRNGMPHQQIMLCIAVRDFTMQTVSTVPDGTPQNLGVYDFKAVKGELYISNYSEAGSNLALYRARVVK